MLNWFTQQQKLTKPSTGDLIVVESATHGETQLGQMRGYLQERGFPINDKLDTYKQSNVMFGGPAECREALGLAPDATDTRCGIIFRFPDSDYAHVRWFGQHKRQDIKAQAPPKRPMQAYISPVCDWNLYNENETLYICESPLKALILSWAGYYAIAGCGVWNLVPHNAFTNNFPHHLKEATGKVVILFDNDFRRNPHVRAAVRRLGNMIKMTWQVPVVNRILLEPPIGSPYQDIARGKDMGKWGIDDAIHHMGKEWLKGWLADEQWEAAVEPTELQRMFDDMSSRYCVCATPPVIIEVETGVMYTGKDFTQLVEADKKVWVENKSNDSGKWLQVATEWVKEPSRTFAKKLVYAPGGVEGHNPEASEFNTWTDSGVPAVKGIDTTVAPFLKVYRNAIPDQETLTLLLQSLAWMLQNREQRLEKTFILVGAQVGSGKSLLANIMGEIVGRRNKITIGSDDFASDFNAIFAQREVILIDDLHKMPKSDVAKLRRSVTSEYLLVNEKGIRKFEIENTGVFFITTNEFSSVQMPSMERRNLVVHFDPTTHYEQGNIWWDNLMHWLEEEEGYGKIRYYLENMDLTGFNHNYMPPMNAVKRHMVGMASNDVETFANDLFENPSMFLPDSVKRSVFSTEELCIIMLGTDDFDKRDVRTLARALGQRFFQANDGKVVRISSGKAGRFWVVRNQDKSWGPKEVKADVASGIQLKAPSTSKY